MDNNKHCTCDSLVMEYSEDEARAGQNRQRHQWKPLAIKAPSLVLFLLLFGVCIGAVEKLISMTRIPPAHESESAGLQRRREEWSDSTSFITVTAQSEESTVSEKYQSSPTSSAGSSTITSCASALQVTNWFSGTSTSGSYAIWVEDELIYYRTSLPGACCNSDTALPLNCLASTRCARIVGQSICTPYDILCEPSSADDNVTNIHGSFTTSSVLPPESCIDTTTEAACAYDISTLQSSYSKDLCPRFTSWFGDGSSQLDSDHQRLFSNWSSSWSAWRQQMTLVSSRCSLSGHSTIIVQYVPMYQVVLTAACQFTSTVYLTRDCYSLDDFTPQTFNPSLEDQHITYSLGLYNTSLYNGCGPPEDLVVLRSTPIVITARANDPLNVSPLADQAGDLSKLALTATSIVSRSSQYDGTVSVRAEQQAAASTQIATSTTKPILLPKSTNSFKSSFNTSQTRNPATSPTTYVVVTSILTTVSTTDRSGRSTNVAAVLVKNVTLTSSPVHSSPSFSFGPNPEYKISSSERELDIEFDKLQYFLALFFAPLTFVIVKGFAEAVMASFKLIEPFHHLSSKIGARATYSLSMQYLSSSISLDMFRSLKRGHLITIWSTLMFCLLAIVTPLAAASTTVRAKAVCDFDGHRSTCEPVWIVNITYLRIVQVILILCAAMVLLLILSTWNYYLNIPGNPSSISSVLSLLNNKLFVGKFQQIEGNVSNRELHASLKYSTFQLGEYIDPKSGSTRLGFLDLSQSKVSEYSQQLSGSANAVLNHHRTNSTIPSAPLLAVKTLGVQNKGAHVSERKSTGLLDLIHLLCATALLCLTLAYHLNGRLDSFNAFFNSKLATPKLLLVGLASLIDAFIKDLEREVRITEPYRRLSKRNTRPETTVLLPLNGTCWSNLPLCISRLRLSDGQMLFQTTVSVVAALSDFNIIAAAGVPYFDGMTTESYKTCTYGVLSITGLIIIVTLVTMLWWRRTYTVRNMPREPNTIAAVCSYLCGSHMVKEWSVDAALGVRLEFLKEAKRNEIILEHERTFHFGRTLSTDGEMRWTVDFERGSVENMDVQC